jgi:hypothetical protein
MKLRNCFHRIFNHHTSYPTWIINPLLACLLVTGIGACEDIIDVDLAEGESQLAVDAWITDQPGVQRIRLTRTTPYFDTAQPPVVEAMVTVTDSEGQTFTFLGPDAQGFYTWDQGLDAVLGQIGRTYTLDIAYEGEQYRATTVIRNVPPIDSIGIELREEAFGTANGYYAVLWARDLPGIGDTYWIRTFKNGEFISQPSEMNLAYDAALGPGGNNDGLVFIIPVREGINPFTIENGRIQPPFALGDSVFVEIYSIPEETFNFMALAREQMTNGGLFATPIANTRTNVSNINPNSRKRAVGFFSGAGVSSAGVRIVE